MIQNFLEWVQIKEEIIEEASTKSQREATDGVVPKPHDFVVFGGEEFLNVVTNKEEKKYDQQFNYGLETPKKILPDPPGWAFSGQSTQLDAQNSPSLRLGIISNVQKTTAEVKPIKGNVNDHVYAKAANFRDVTDAFDTETLPPKIRILLCMGLVRHAVTTSSEEYVVLSRRYEKWRALASSHTNPQQLALDAGMKGAEAARDEERKKARTEVNSFYKGLDQSIQQGEDVSMEIKNLSDEFAEPGFVSNLRRLKLHNLVNKAYEVLGPQNVAEDEPPQQEISPLDRLMGSPQPGTQAEPQYSMQGRNVVANPNQMAAMTLAKRPETPDERVKRFMMGLEHDQTIMGFRRLWKNHNDLKDYGYIEG